MSAVVSPTASGISPANLLYRSRKRVNIFMLGVSGLALAFGLFWLAWILGTLFYEGGHALARTRLYFEMTPPPGPTAALPTPSRAAPCSSPWPLCSARRSAVLTGTYLAEYGERGWIAPATRFIQ